MITFGGNSQQHSALHAEAKEQDRIQIDAAFTR